MPGLDAGSVDVRLGAVVDEHGFHAFDARVRKADRQKAVAQLGARIDDRTFATADKRVDAFDRKVATAELKLDKDDFDRGIKEGERELENLKRRRGRLLFRADIDSVAAQEKLRALDGKIATVDDRLDRMRRKRVEIEVDVDRSSLDRIGDQIKSRLSAVGEGGGGGGRRGLLVGLGGMGGSGRLASVLATKSLPALAATAIVAQGALNALAAAAVALGAALAPLVGILGAIPGAITGLAQAGLSLFATFKGIPDAVKAGLDAQKKSSVDTTAALQQQRSATDAIKSAEEAQQNAQRSARVAQEQLTQARQDATRQLEDLKNASRNAQLQEQSAALSLRESEAELRRVSSDPQSTQLDVERAQLGVKQARQQAREASTEARRAQRDSQRASAGGEDKMPQVVAAIRARDDANRAAASSTRALARAQEDAAAGSAKFSSSQEKLKEAMEGLSPAGQRFARFLIRLKEPLKSIRDASQEAALPHFQRGIQAAMKNLGPFRTALTNTSRVFGTAAERMGKFVGSKGFGKDFQIIGRANNNVLRNLGRAAIPLTKAFMDIGVAAAPFTRWLGRMVLHLARLTASWAKNARESGSFAKFLRRTRDTLEAWGKIIGNLTHGLAGFFHASYGSGQDFLGLLVRLTDKFDNWANSTKGQNSIKKWLEDAKGPLRALGDALRSVLILFKDLASAPGAGAGFMVWARAVKLFADALDFLAKIPGVGTVLANIALLAVVAGRFGKLGAAIKGMSALAAGIRGITAAEAAAGTGGGARGLGLKIRQLFQRAFGARAMTTVGTNAAGEVSGGFGAAIGGKMRAATTRVRGILARVFGRAGTTAGTAAGEQAGAEFGAAATGRLGKLRARFRTIGMRLGGALLLGLGAAAAGFGIGWLLSEFLNDKTDGAFARVGRRWMEAITNGLVDAANAVSGPVRGLLGKIGIDVGEIGHVSLPTGGKGGKTKPPPAVLGGPAGRQGPVRPGRAAGPTAQPRKVQTVEVDPVVGVAGLPTSRGIRRQMDRASDTIRKEFGQLGRLLERQAKRLDDPFRNLRLLRGRDPLGLERAVRRSGEDSEGIAQRWARKIGQAFESISRFARIEGRETGRSFADGLTASLQNAEERVRDMRIKLVSDFRAMSRIGSAEARELASNLRGTFGRLPAIVQGPTAEMLRIVAQALKGLGVGGAEKLRASATRIEERARGGPVRKAVGGVVEGVGLQDSFYLPQKPGNFVANRHQAPWLVEALSSVGERLAGYAKGGRTILRKAFGGLVDTLVAPGEVILDRDRDVPLADRAMRQRFGFGLNALASRISTPHYAADGGRVPADKSRQKSRPATSGAVSRVISNFAKGGVTPGRYVSTAYGPPWGGIQGTGTTAGGTNLKPAKKAFIVAVDPRRISLGSKVSIWPNPFKRRADFLADDTGGAIKGNRIDFYDWRGRGKQLGWGTRRVTVHTGGKGRKAAADDLAGPSGGTSSRVKARVAGPKGGVTAMVKGGVKRVERAANKVLARAGRGRGRAAKGDDSTGYVPASSIKGGGRLQLPAMFKATHDTDGLPTYPFAQDFFAPAGTKVLSPVAGKVTRFSGRGGTSGQVYGYSMYIDAKDRGYFGTHFGSRSVKPGQKVKPGTVLGTVSAWDGATHIHWARNKARGGFIQRLANGGLVGRIQRLARGVVGRAKGGFVGRAVQSLAKGGAVRKDERQERRVVGRFRGEVGRVWRAARRYFPNARGLPRIAVRSDQRVGFGNLAVTLIGGKHRRVLWPASEVDDFLEHKGEDLDTLLHEWAHVHQRRDVIKQERLREGSATLFARRVLPRVAQRLGWRVGHSGYQKTPSRRYGQFASAVARRGSDWVLHDQFVEPVTKAEKGTRAQARKQEQEKRARGGFVGAVQRFAQGGAVRAQRFIKPVVKAVQSFARGGIVAPVVQAFARGGLVKRIQGFAKGGTVKSIAKSIVATPPPGAKRPSRQKSGRSKGAVIKLKPFRPGRIGSYVSSPLQSGFDQVWNQELPFLEEDYGEYQEDADLTQEEYLVDPPGGGTQTVDWAAVRIRIAELNGLLTRAQAVWDRIDRAKGLALSMIAELKAVAKAQLQRVAQIYKRITENIERLKRLRAHLKNERKKKGKHRDQGAINYIENLIAAIEAQNTELGGSPSSLPRDWTQLDDASALGKIASIVNTVSDGLSPDGEGPAGKLVEIQGLTGRGGKLDDWADNIRQWTAEKLDLQPGGKLVTPAAGTTGESAESAAAQISSFLRALGDLQKDYAPNIRTMPNFGGGGIVPGPLGKPIQVTAHGEEVYFDPRTGDFNIVIKRDKGGKDGGDKNVHVDARSYFQGIGPDPHFRSRAVKQELDSLL